MTDTSFVIDKPKKKRGAKRETTSFERIMELRRQDEAKARRELKLIK
jgi:hypothetical protein